MKTDQLRRQFDQYIRSASAAQSLDLNTREAAVVPSTLNSDERTVSCVIASERPTEVFDFRTGRVILEVLQVAGVEHAAETPLLRDHNRWEVLSIVGNVTSHEPKRDELRALLTFGTDLDEEAESVWRRVDQGYLKFVSVGYSYGDGDFVTIEPGQKATVGGRKYTAPKERALRVVRRWKLSEVSCIVIPADERASMRDANGGTGNGGDLDSHHSDTGSNIPSPSPNQRNVKPLIVFLRSRGLPDDISETDAALDWARENLGRGHFARLHELCRSESIEEFSADDFPLRSDPPSDSAGGDSPTGGNGSAGAAGADGSGDDVGVRAAADDQAIATAERNRCAEILALCRQHNIADEIREDLIRSGATLDRARQRILDGMRGAAPPAAPAVQARDRSPGNQLRAFQAALLGRIGVDPDHDCLRHDALANVINRAGFNAGWLRGAQRTGTARDEVERAWDAAAEQGLRGGSFGRLCEEMLRMDGQTVPYDQGELIERSFASANFNALFGTTVHISLLAGYTNTPAQYQNFCRVKDVKDFRPDQDAILGHVTGLKKQGATGGKAPNLLVDDPTLQSVTAERYAGVLKITDMVIINDSFDVLDRTAPEVGAAAMQIPNDIALSIVLGNETMADTNALFHAASGSLIDPGTLDEDGVATALATLEGKKFNGRRIVVTAAVLMTGLELQVDAKKVLNSTTTPSGEDNVLRDIARHLKESALTTGVDDPRNDPATSIAAKPGSYYLFAEPFRSICIAFRQGTNRGPITRSTTLDKGEWGRCWDVYIDVGGAPQSRIGALEVRLA